MYKRLPLLALCLTAAALGASACDASGDSRSSAPAASASASASASAAASTPAAAPSGSPSDSPAEARRLTGPMREVYLRTLRKNYPDLDRISDDVLVEHGDAFCAARGQALGDQAKKTMRELDLTPKQATPIVATAHAYCR
ncbi:hypothetical protein LE181_04805 [Streptomyces sp. SCA3-4]|uniref:hypothetical protein n=1 Tax=Streptomyces sichuanensis TaxID=2871810 RepID=UPI001CE2B77B|nr:hypothetical protein [Streptomyces sichuanensis]MCA6091486.1 hypothetical protein [Streptomyces sichuanensis]